MKGISSMDLRHPSGVELEALCIVQHVEEPLPIYKRQI